MKTTTTFGGHASGCFSTAHQPRLGGLERGRPAPHARRVARCPLVSPHAPVAERQMT